MGQKKYPPLTPNEVVEILSRVGFSKRGQEGSHAQYFKAGSENHITSNVTVDMAYREFDCDLIKSMIRQSNYSRDEFYGATKRSARKAGVKLLSPSEDRAK